MLKIIKRFYSFILWRKKAFFAFLIVLVASSVFSSLIPYVTKIITDVVFYSDYQLVLFLVLLAVGLRVLSQILGVWASYLGDKALIPVVRDVRIKIFEHVQNLDFGFHVGKSTGSLISAFKRGDNAFWGLHIDINYDIVSILASLVVMLFFFSSIDSLIVLIMLASLILNSGIGLILVKINMKRRAAFNKSEDRVSGIITDNLLNYETVQYFAAEDREVKRLTKEFRDWTKKIWSYAMSFRFIGLTVGFLSSLGALFIFLLVLKRLNQGQASPGDLIMVISFVGSFYYQFFGLIWKMRNIAKSFTDIERYFSLLDQIPEIKDPEKPKVLKKVKGEIIFDHVTFDYPKGKEGALVDFNIHIPAGQVIAFAGKSGAGKTTISNLLLRLYDPTKGKIEIDGVDIREMTKKDLRSIVGIVPQEPILFNDTIQFNIGFGKKGATLEQIKRAAKLAHIHDFIETLPKKYKTMVGERGVKLSGGQKQRVAIARMILADPRIIIFDEATSNLDSYSEFLIQRSLWRIAKGRTLIIIAHRFSTIMKADKIVVLENGRIVQSGSHQDLAKKKGLYKKLWELQLEV
jgi:ATP-binding cassette subfamily B protein